ncbi:hypothetical protein [Pseudomonas protegens]|uniref:hypothetical protein n=1 Tax=Pseudomonas protegens TaxID=380021 RepID=UPI0011AF6852|nr:hypothetical protein [Pseudomonas protegens]
MKNLTQEPTYPGLDRQQGARKYRENTLARLYRYSWTGVFCFFSALAQLLLKATKLTDRMVFYSKEKRRHTRASSQKKRGTTYLGATE